LTLVAGRQLAAFAFYRYRRPLWNEIRLPSLAINVPLWGALRGRVMNDGRADVYLVQAARCLKLAQGSHDTANKLTLLDLARAWLTIAEQGEKNRSVTLVDKTPLRHE
jgi:hypothetical protein